MYYAFCYCSLQIYIKYDDQYPMSEWRFELRVRYSPDDMEDLYDKDRFTYFFYYDQVRINILFCFQTYSFFKIIVFKIIFDVQ